MLRIDSHIRKTQQKYIFSILTTGLKETALRTPLNEFVVSFI